MMQQVATTKSEIAAIATSVGQELQLDSGLSQDFEQMLQDQQRKEFALSTPSKKDNHDNADKVDKPTVSSAKKASEQEEAQKTESEVQSQYAPSQNASSQSTAAQSKTADEKKAKAEESSTPKTEEFSKSKNEDKFALQEPTEFVNEQNSDSTLLIDNQSAQEPVNKKTIGISTQEPQILTYLEEKTSSDKAITQSTNANEWVDLVGNLQKLSSLAEASVKPVVNKQIEENHLVAKASVENTSEYEGAVDEIVKKLLAGLSNDDSSKPKAKLDSDEKIQFSLEEMIKQPDVLKQVLGAINSLTNQEQSDVTGGDLQRVESIDAESLLQSDKNIALLASLLNLEAAKNNAPEETSVVGESNTPEENLVADESLLLEQSNFLNNQKSDETQDLVPHTNNKVKNSISASENSVITEQINTVVTDAAVKPSVVKIIANLPEAKQNAVLTNIAKQLLGSEQVTENKLTATLDNVAKSELSDLVSNASSPIKEFIGALKSGVSEFKSQLSQGREPGMDLKSLVSESLNKVIESNPNVKIANNSEQVLNGISQLIDFSSSLNRSIEQQLPAQSQTYNAMLRDVSQIQGEQTKQTQISQLETKFEKAVNIAKPEGLQQLAEKVRWMANSRNLVAEIRLDPADLGSVHVKVAMSGDSATVNFVVQSQHAREAMDNATPRLREMLAEKGIELGQSSVKQESGTQQQKEQGELAGKANSVNEENEEVDAAEHSEIQQRVVNGSLGGIDYFA
ncbi:flagellar hook-length control protein FliK [Paraglaciecola sp.]|uniref:flagellar hook-length control protein FliK n=1 Tax=Paraglaciecola sp. TaxID=1920173 RepID=UPI003EF76BD9